MVQVLGILVGFFIIRRLLRRAIEAPVEAGEEEEVPLPEATREDLRRQEVSTEITRLSQSNPDVVAQLLRTWMAEGNE